MFRGNSLTEFDYIIVGAGSAGCVLAYRLTENPGVQVLVVEAGPEDSNYLLSMPMGIGRTLTRPSLTWNYLTEPEPARGDLPYYWLRGKVLGGSSSVNGMLYFRGQPQDYDGWEDLGCSGWGWQEMSRCFREMENHELGDDGVRGVGGPLYVSTQRTRTPLTEAILQAGAAMGLPVKVDLNGYDQEGIGYSPRTIKKGKRVSAATAFLSPARRRPNLTVRTGVLVARVLFDNKHARGITALSGDHVLRFTARKEVFICAGALQSPVLLQQSGIGPGAHLKSLGIELVHDNPNVGSNLREHKSISMNIRLKQPYSLNRALTGWRLYVNSLRYFASCTGPLAATYDVNAFIRTRPELDRPDAQLTFWALTLKRGTMLPETEPGLMMMGYPLRTESEGSVLIRSTDPADPPIIRANFLSTEHDRRVIVDLFRFARRLLNQPALRPLLGPVTHPGGPLQSDAEIVAACHQAETCLHAVGTCRMGSDAAAVVDDRLRVRGVTGLRIIDCSVMPTQVSGNTNGPVMAMAWRAAELIKQTAET
jgi:choline dehydrogenase